MTDKKREVRQTRRRQKSFKTKCKSARFKPVDFSIKSRVQHFFVRIYFSNEKLTESYQVKSK